MLSPEGEPVELAWLADEVSAREREWTAVGIAASFHRDPPTDKPAAWVDLDRGAQHGQLIVWVSGEAELAFLPEASQEPTNVHLDLTGCRDLQDPVDELEWCIGMVPARRAKARRAAVHARWVSVGRNRDTADPDYRNEWYFEQCGGCWHWLALGGSLGADWGVCANEDTPFDGRVRFEHDGCSDYLASPDGFGTQRG